jgi:hypothetical protein
MYNQGMVSTNNYDSTLKHINSIDSNGCGPSKNWEKIFGPPLLDQKQRSYENKKD